MRHAICLVAFAALNSGCAKEQAAPPSRPPARVTLAKVIQKTMPVEVTSVGNVEAISMISIRTQVAGEVQEIRFKEGDFVKKGQVLLTIDARPYEAALAQAKGALARDKATGTYNRVQAMRYKTLFDEGVVPAQQVDSFSSAADASDATVSADEAAVKTAELNLEYCTIRSPIDGRTGTVMVKAGNLVKVADVPIVVVNQVDPIYVNFTVPQKYWPDVKERVDRHALHVTVTIPQNSGRPVDGTLTFVDNIVDTTTGTIHLRGTFENSENRLWPGLYVSVLLTLSEQPDAIVVPAQSIVATQENSYVYVVQANNIVEQRTIVPSRTIENETVVDKGLKPGETIVIDGQVNLVPGAKIEAKNGGPDATAEPSGRPAAVAGPIEHAGANADSSSADTNRPKKQ
ncbi:MAG TPA: efflux RND transporter periplasmic adaptor subunit [Candidatus Acidoferrales bacterium]|jgi:multidrug efflux system membrane fusion protein|nr:efflux RND transporter periplasmic adaptor subunit [Candidatus Acidoferrales bacterium]